MERGEPSPDATHARLASSRPTTDPTKPVLTRAAPSVLQAYTRHRPGPLGAAPADVLRSRRAARLQVGGRGPRGIAMGLQWAGTHVVAGTVC